MSNKYSTRRSNPGKPKICKSKPPPPPIIIPPLPWPPDALCLSFTLSHTIPPYEVYVLHLTLPYASPGTPYAVVSLFAGLIISASAEVPIIGSPDDVHISAYDYETLEASLEGETTSIPASPPWSLPVNGIFYANHWSLSAVSLAYGACSGT